MRAEKGAHGATRNVQAWLLGGRHPAADKSIVWSGPFPNMADPDVLIVDLTTLDKDTLSRIDVDALRTAQKAIKDKVFAGGGTVVVVTQPEFSAPLWSRLAGGPTVPFNGLPPGSHMCSSYRMLPVVLKTIPVPTGEKIIVDDGHDFKEYLDGISRFTFYIEECPPIPHPRHGTISLETVEGQGIRDNSGRYLGFTLAAPGVAGGAGQAKSTGKIVFLPPYTEPANAAIKKIFSVYGKTLDREPLPPWAEKISFRKADQLRAEILGKKKAIGTIQCEMADLARQEDEILGHRLLLCAKGRDLETAVVAAFKTLGLADARRAGRGDQPDCILDMNTDGYLHGLVEVKGADGRTKEADISQCVKWVDKAHAEDGKWSKAIFVPNQHRMREYPESREDRLWFEEKERDYAETKKVCIIPSCVLFEAVGKAIDVKTPDTAEVIKNIASAEGVLESVF